MKLFSKSYLALLGFFLIFLLPEYAGGQTPSVRNFPRTMYGGGAQNWKVAQDSLGRIYLGNRVGLIVADGSSWNLLKLPNYSTVRSVLIDELSDRVYVGGSEEFGYFDFSNPFRTPVYRSLTASITAPQSDFSEVWNIHRGERVIWFQSDFKIFRWNGAEQTDVIDIDDKITASATIGDRLYAGLLHRGLVYVSEHRAHPVDGAEALEGKRIVSILEDHRGGILIVTAYDGLWRLDGSVLTPQQGAVSDFLKRNQAFCATYDRRSGQYAFGTVAGGVVYFAANNPDRAQYVDMTDGLQDNTVLSLSFDRDANLWLGLDNGLDYVVGNSAMSRLPLPGGALGAGYTSLIDGQRLLLGTNRGLYLFGYPLVAKYPFIPPDPVVKGQMWFIEQLGGDVFAGGDAGLWVSRPGGPFARVDNVGGSWGIHAVPGHDELVMVSTYDGFVILRRDAPGSWSFVNRISGYTDAGGRFVVNDRLVVWIAHWMKGLYRLKLSGDLTHFESVRLLTKEDGLPTNRDNLVSEVNGRTVISTEEGFYHFDDASGRFMADSVLNNVFGKRHSARIYTAPDGVMWSVSPENVWIARADAAGVLRLDTVTFQPLAETLIPGFDHFYFDGRSKAIVASQEGFFEVNLGGQRHAVTNPELFVSRVYAGRDSMVYNAPFFRKHPDSEHLTVSYDLNSLRFDIAMPEYRADKAVKYSFKLENYDDDWSAWSPASSKEYTQLSEGTYTLHVRARDGYSGLAGQTEFVFTVRPPWYRSAVAKIVYLILIVFMVWFAIRTVRNASQRSTREMAARKEAEIVSMRRKSDEEAMHKDYEIAHLKSQQLEHDIKHKSEELSNITMNLIRKNEILLDIDGRIAKLRESMGVDVDATPEGKQLQRIHRLIQDNISHDDDWRAFTRNFDVVYENYTKRLVEAHPDLSQSDLRICCYLKMGLSSKDIAPLFNISYRSVEMTRYRLRKKLGLTRETNLVDYLQKF